jgi:hypothetical protein
VNAIPGKWIKSARSVSKAALIVGVALLTTLPNTVRAEHAAFKDWGALTGWDVDAVLSGGGAKYNIRLAINGDNFPAGDDVGHHGLVRTDVTFNAPGFFDGATVTLKWTSGGESSSVTSDAGWTGRLKAERPAAQGTFSYTLQIVGGDNGNNWCNKIVEGTFTWT